VFTLGLSLFCFAGVILVQKFVLLSGVPIMALVMLRTLFPGLAVLISEVICGRGEATRKIFTPYFFWLACATTLVPLFLKNLAHKNMPSANFALLGSLDPFITCVLVYLLFGETINWRQAGGIGCAALGAAILSPYKLTGEAAVRILGGFPWPEILVLISITLGRLGWIASGALIKQGQMSERQTNIMFMLLPGFLATALAGVSGQINALISGTNLATWTAIGLSVSLNTLACMLMTQSLRKFSAVTISLAGTSIIPLTVALFSYPIYGETLSVNFFVAGGLIFLGLAIFNLYPNKAG
jgi:drug/metabolite transporter (DMT)-like permease